MADLSAATMTMNTKSALSYFGSDAEVAGKLAVMLNHCRHVTIPFCGGLSILPHLTARAIVANDRNDLAINFYRVASGASGELDRQFLFSRCQHTLSHPGELDLAARTLKDWSDGIATKAQAAWGYWATCWIARKGQGGTTSEGRGSPSIRWTANGGTNASRIRAAADDLPDWAKHFERCEWLNDDFLKLLPKVHDDATCGLYCDPPWRGLGDGYIHSFKNDDHIALRTLLGRFEQTAVVVRYGDDPFIRDLYSGPQWTILDAASRTQSNAIKGEIWITNWHEPQPAPKRF